MKTKIAICFFALAVTACWGLCSEASAGNGFCTGYYGYSAPNHYVGRSIPYFAAHPPVYYSYPRARPYGYSPYAWPPVVTPGATVSAEQPVVIKNPHVQQQADEVAVDSRSAAAPLRFANPYVVRAMAIEPIEPPAEVVPAGLTMPVVIEGVVE